MEKKPEVFLFFLMAGLLLFSNSLNNKFIIDDYAFLKNPLHSSKKFILAQWDPFIEQSRGVFDNHEYPVYYRPATQMVYDLSYDLFKQNYFAYHLLNLLLFVTACFFIFLMVEMMTKDHVWAVLTGLFYLIHPINGIMVNYISADVFALQVLFTLGAILTLWLSMERGHDPKLYFLSLLLSFLSLFWHESGIMNPFYAAAFILLLGKDPLKQKIYCIVPYFLIGLAYFIFRCFFISINEMVFRKLALFHMTPGEYLANLSRCLIWYISRLFYPSGIVMQWAKPLLHDHILGWILGLCLLLIICLWLYVKLDKVSTLRLALAWLVIGFMPVGAAAFGRPDHGPQIEPHWFVISSIGFFIFAAYFCAFVLDRTRQGGIILLFLLIFSWAAVSRANNQLWSDQKTYALYWAKQDPQLKDTYLYLADAYGREGSSDESRKYYGLALSGNPVDLDIYNNLGVMDMGQGRWADAESNFKKILKITSDCGAYCNLGTIYLHQGRMAQARESYEKSLIIDPLRTEARRGLATIALRNSQYQKAIDLCLKNLEIENNDPQTLLMLISVFLQDKDRVSLQKWAYRLINTCTDPKVLVKLGIALDENHASGIALDSFKQAIRVAPDDKDAYLALGILLARFGQYDKAIHIWKIGSTIDPSDRRFQKCILQASH